MSEAIPLMGAAFLAISQSSAQAVERQALKLESGFSLLMSATAKSQGVVAKLVSVFPGNSSRGLPSTTGMALLADDQDGRTLALFDATALTAWRTAAAVGFATHLLSRPDVKTGLLIGCGTQARAQLLAMDAARPLREIRVMARDPQRVREFVERVRGEVRAELHIVGGEEADRTNAVSNADVIAAATTSTVPVIPGSIVQPGCHVSGVGSFRPGMSEFDQDLIRRATIYVESRHTASAEAGELIAGIEAGATEMSSWRQVGDVVDGKTEGRSRHDEITFYKSVGHAVFDLFAASAVYRHAEARDLGTKWVP